MRVMVMVKVITAASKACGDPQFLAEMRKFNDTLANAGVLLAVDRLRPAAEGARVRLSGTKRTVLDGPFAETKELIGGFWMWRVKSMEEAIEWVKRCPAASDGEFEIEIREVIESDDFAPALARARAVAEQGQRKHAQAGGRH